MEDSHLITEPVCPLKASVPLLAPVQTDALDATDPPTEPPLMVIIAAEEFAASQAPLLTTALYRVVWVKLRYD